MMKIENIFKVSDETKAKREFNSIKYDFLEKFYRYMFELGFANKFRDTYKLDILNKTNYGFFAHLYLSPGLSFSKLKANIGELQENLSCIWIMKFEPFKTYAEVKIVTKPLDETIPFEKIEINGWEMYLGLDFSLQPIKINVNRHCHFLIAGATGAGKTRLQYMILTSWILNCKTNFDCEMFLGDLAKDSFSAFEYVKNVKYYARELEEFHKMLKYIDRRLKKRKRLIGEKRSSGLANNIEEYNKIEKFKMGYIYLMIDEFSSIIPDNTDSKEEKQMKNECIDIVKRIAKTGREMGIFLIIGVQKTVKDEIPSIIKNMAAVRISFRANDMISSEVIMGDHSAVGLADRYAVYSLNGGEKQDYLFSPNLPTERLSGLLAPFIDRNVKKADLTYDDTPAKAENIKTYPVFKNGPEIKDKESPFEVFDSSSEAYEVV